ncbi:MAG TPA: ABC transporter permease [Bryobacteraceae bacterium]|nr:ABC transporter permease [Bryobacteraceae bacterium]
MTSRRALARLVALVHKRQLDGELDDEIRGHLQLAEQDAVLRGLSPEEARQEARRAFGGIEQMKEAHRDRRGVRWMEVLLKDFRYGLASLRRAPGFTAVIAGVLALGIGGTIAMFSIVDAVLLKPLPFRDPEQIVGVWEAPRPGAVNATTVPQFLAWKRDANSFKALAAEAPISSSLNEKDGPVRLAGDLVTAEYFRIFATETTMGRTFRPEEDQPGASPVIVISHAVWETYFGSDPGILGRRVILDGERCQVIGVLRPGAFDRSPIQFWKALIFTSAQRSSDNHWLTVYGRLRANVALNQARSEMQSLYTTMMQTMPANDRGGAMVVEPFARLLIGPNLHRSILIAFGAVFLVLLIACTNVANLLFAHGATRGTELAVRAALGAGRGRLIAQLLTEASVLCLFGGIAGVGLAYFLIYLAAPLLAQSLPFTAAVNINFQVLAFAAAVVFFVALLAGVFPAFRASSGDLAGSLKQAVRGTATASAGVRRSLVIGELALSLVLVSGALLLIKSLVKLQQLDTGVRIENVVTASIDLPAQAYPTPQKAALFYDALTQQLHSIAPAEKVALSTYLPLQWVSNGEAIQVPGAQRLLHVRFKRVSPGYFSTLDIPVLSGRGITEQDRDGTPRVVVINQALAASLAQDAGITRPIGRSVRLSSVDYSGTKPLMLDVQIAGVIRSERTSSPGRPDPAVVYVPLAQSPSPNVKLLVRTRNKVTSIVPAIRDALHNVDANLPLGNIATLQQVLDETLSPASRPAWLVGGFALIAVLLAVIGLYGLISHSVTQQRREIGIRMALGARSSDVLSQILRGSLVTVLISIAFGLLGTFVLTRVLQGMLFEVSPLDPLVLAAACICMVLIGLLAGFAPARRATRIDPAVTLRDGG